MRNVAGDLHINQQVLISTQQNVIEVAGNTLHSKLHN